MTDENGLIAMFTANVNCLSCQMALLATWRADDKLAPEVQKLFQDFRGKHVNHVGFREGPPGIGVHAPEDPLVTPPSRTIVNSVVCKQNPDHPGHLVFSNPSNSVYFSV